MDVQNAHEVRGLDVACTTILMRRIRFVHFLFNLSTLVYFFRCGHASLVKIQGSKEVIERCHYSKCVRRSEY